MYRQQTRRKRLAVHTRNVVTRLFADGKPVCKRSFFVQDLTAEEWFPETSQYFH